MSPPSLSFLTSYSVFPATSDSWVPSFAPCWNNVMWCVSQYFLPSRWEQLKHAYWAQCGETSSSSPNSPFFHSYITCLNVVLFVRLCVLLDGNVCHGALHFTEHFVLCSIKPSSNLSGQDKHLLARSEVDINHLIIEVILWADACFAPKENRKSCQKKKSPWHSTDVSFPSDRAELNMFA